MKLRRRPSSRLLVISPNDEVLLFHFVHECGALSGKSYWATPGGRVEETENWAEAARRELLEETGISVGAVGPEIASRQFLLRCPDGEDVLAEEHFFVVRPTNKALSFVRWTAEEREVIREHKWWTIEELRWTGETIYPDDLVAMLDGAHGTK